jgi:hypothetical protein
MVEFTVAKTKVGPLIERYQNGEYHSVDKRNNEGVKRMALVKLDNSHSKDYKVAYASDPLLVIHGRSGVTHTELRATLEDLEIWSVANFTPIEIPHGTGWISGFKTTPDRVHLIDRIYTKCEQQIAEQDLIGDKENFSVYY